MVILAGCSSSSPKRVTAPPSDQPNIVFVLTDDLDLTTFADAARFPVFHDLMTAQGTTFSNYFVTDSLCCPSRSSILRGQYVHNHGVKGNVEPRGGFARWQALGRDTSTMATWLHDDGYRTALFGKYLNGYPDTVARTYIPPGWDEWASPSGGNPYAEFNYQLNENGSLHRYGTDDDAYLVDRLTEKAQQFIKRSGSKPFFMYLAPYVPHQPATPAPRYASTFDGVTAPRTPSYEQADVSAEPAYIRDRRPFSPALTTYIDELYRKRLQSMLGVQDMLAHIIDTLRANGTLDNTYIVFTSDNGFHLGQHRLPPGKQTPFEEDIHVPLVVRGPGVAKGATISSFAREIDLAPTFAALARTSPASFADGRSLVPALDGTTKTTGLHDVLIEHYDAAATAAARKRARTPTTNEPDDDAHPPVAGAPTSGPSAPVHVPSAEATVEIPTYKALRTERYLYAEYATGEKQLYDVGRDPDELHNLAAAAPQSLLTILAARLHTLARCHAASCS